VLHVLRIVSEYIHTHDQSLFGAPKHSKGFAIAQLKMYLCFILRILIGVRASEVLALLTARILLNKLSESCASSYACTFDIVQKKSKAQNLVGNRTRKSSK